MDKSVFPVFSSVERKLLTIENDPRLHFAELNGCSLYERLTCGNNLKEASICFIKTCGNDGKDSLKESNSLCIFHSLLLA